MINNKILIVDDSNVIKKLMTLHLSKNGYEVFTASSTLEAASILLKENIVLVITSINMPTFSGLDFLIWLKKYKPGIKIIVMTAFSNEETKELIIKNMGISYFEKGSDYANLDKMINKVISSSQFEVEIKEINLFEFFYMIILSKKTKLVSILEKSKNKRGLVYFKEGKIIHAKFNEFEGEKALFEIIKIKDGDFIEHDWVEPEKITINIAFDFLLMNMAQNANNVTDTSQENTEFYNSNVKKEVVIFEDSLEITRTLKDSLKEKDFVITRIFSSDDFMGTIKSKNFGLIICDIRMIELKGLDFLLWLKNNQNNTRVLILSDSISHEAKSFAQKYSTISYLKKPINLAELNDFLEKYMENSFSDKLFSGSIKDVSLFDFIQVISFSKKNKLVSVVDPSLQSSGFLYIKDGSIIHSEFDNLSGEEAFYKMSENKKMVFSDLIWSEPKEQTIHIGLSNLILKAVRTLEDDNKLENIKLKSNLGNLISSDLASFERELESLNRGSKPLVVDTEITEY